MKTTASELLIETVRFRSGHYRLEGELLYPETKQPRGVVVMANPHPLLGGRMTNNVVQELSSGLAEREFTALRFNYRGVGGSDGPERDIAKHIAEFVRTSHVADELELCFDLAAAVEFARSAVGINLPVIGVGYSFGCALLGHCLSQTAALVLIAPTLSRHNYATFRSATQPKLVIASQDDFATDAATLRHWFDDLPAPKHLIHQRIDNHFFRGHERWLAEVVADFVDAEWEGILSGR
jgi:alpha/beta superfamily hydrolase